MGSEMCIRDRQPIAPTSPPPPLVDKQTGAPWGPLELRIEERQRGRGRGGQGPNSASATATPGAMASKSLQGALDKGQLEAWPADAPSRVPQERGESARAEGGGRERERELRPPEKRQVPRLFDKV